jgi:hypothetical protein
LIALTENVSSFPGFGASATCSRRAKYIRVLTIVITPFEFRDIKGQVFAANFVEAAHDAALQKRPKAIDRLSMDRAVDVLASAVPDNAVFFKLRYPG